VWRFRLTGAAFLFALCSAIAGAAVGGLVLQSQDPSGQIRTVDTAGQLDTSNPFFQNLGTNGRRCNSCHLPDQGWTITPQAVQQRFAATGGLDPIFRANDGSNCQNADISTLSERQRAFSLLLSRGLIRVGIDVPANAEFEIVSVDDPYACPANLVSAVPTASMYRRPLPATNLPFLTTFMWDGREPSLAQQANSATVGHAQGAPLTVAQENAIVAFETSLFTAQGQDHVAGNLSAAGASGGPDGLPRQPFFVGINDPVGLNPKGEPFNPRVFTIFSAWSTLLGNDATTQVRRSIARGEEIFNTRQFTIEGVAGLNGTTFSSGVTVPSSFTGTCTVCHDSPNLGNHSVKAPLNIGLTDPVRRTPDMPLFTLRNKQTNAVVQTTDPGRAMITGKWDDIGKFKGPILRGLAARAPYFHNGFAATLEDVIDFYDTRFDIGLTAQEKADLAAFLRVL
jgi:cytochrome c peroxidase